MYINIIVLPCFKLIWNKMMDYRIEQYGYRYIRRTYLPFMTPYNLLAMELDLRGNLLPLYSIDSMGINLNSFIVLLIVGGLNQFIAHFIVRHNLSASCFIWWSAYLLEVNNQQIWGTENCIYSFAAV